MAKRRSAFTDFFSLLIPAIVNFAIPAAIMNFFIPQERPAAVMEAQAMKRGGWIIHLFVCIDHYYVSVLETFSVCHLRPG